MMRWDHAKKEREEKSLNEKTDDIGGVQQKAEGEKKMKKYKSVYIRSVIRRIERQLLFFNEYKAILYL